VIKLRDLLKHAADCHEMARTATPAHREQLEKMATAWEELAETRKRQLEKSGKTDENGGLV
jgi:hypothetical protein